MLLLCECKKSQLVNSLRFNCCITILCKCTCAAFVITKIQMLHNIDIVTLCNQYRVSTSLYRCEDISHICAALHIHNWRY